ncbi:hypothetical protein MBLNU457_2144t1 [Dothideomycetes sp. NU457]
MAPTTVSPISVNDYTILTLACSSTTSLPKKATHYLYLRQHEPKVSTPTSDREIFAVNTPVDATEFHIRTLFANQLGGARVEAVTFEDGRSKTSKLTPQVAGKKRKRSQSSSQATLTALPEEWNRELHPSGTSAIITMVDSASVELALREARKAAKSRKDLPWPSSSEAKTAQLGSARYTAHHDLRYPDAASLLASIDAFMTSFANKEAERSRLLARQRQEPDEDGFVTVVRGGRAGPARQAEAEEKLARQNEKQKGKEDFYRFQMRDKRKERANELLKGFEEDRRRVMEMKKSRNKFRPH